MSGNGLDVPATPLDHVVIHCRQSLPDREDLGSCVTHVSRTGFGCDHRNATNAQRLEETAAALRDRRRLDAKAEVETVRNLAIAAKRARRGLEVAMAMWQLSPTSSNRQALAEATAARREAMAALRENSATTTTWCPPRSDGSADMARHVTPDRAIVGLATVFNAPSRDGNVWSADQLSLAWDLEMPIPLLIDHGPIVASHGFIDNVGEIYRFAHVTYPLDAMLILGEIDYAQGFGDSILSDLRANLNQLYLPPTWGFSVGGWRDADTGEVVLSEVSLTRRPAYSDARVLATGAEAVELFAMLTEKRPVTR